MSEPTKPRLKVSREGVVLIKSFEGFRPRAVQNDDGRWIIGYGHTASAREGLSVSEADAELLLQYDLIPIVRTVNDAADGLNQHQFDALASFALSVGLDRFAGSDVVRQLQAGALAQAADALFDWPETQVDAGLRRRAAERALFVADPSSPVHLADLLAAPLPPPPAPEPEPVAETPVEVPTFAPSAPPADARAAAVASLLGESPDEVSAEPVPVETEVTTEVTPDVSAPPSSFDTPIPVTTRIQLQRFAPYAATMLGPLPEVVRAQPIAAEPLPVETETAETEAVEPETPHVPVADPAPLVETAAQVAPVTTAVIWPEPSPQPVFPPLVLTAPSEADMIGVERPAWSDDQRLAPTAIDQTPLFGDEADTGQVLRHESEPDLPRRFDWSETGAFLIMGGVGLAACGAAAAAFRLSAEQPSPMGETTVLAWALSLIGLVCVSVSGWNLYVRWGRSSDS